MEEVEYLEEYEDLILPIMSSNSVAANKNRTNTNTNGDDEDSSSIDQDIFESLFDDQSDDDVPPPKKDPKLSQRHPTDRFSLDSLDMLVKDLVGEQLSPSSKTTQTNKPDMGSDKSKQQGKSIRKDISSTKLPTARSNISHTSNDHISSQKTDGAALLDKPKSVATVRPTVQQIETQVLEKNASTKTAPQNRDKNPLSNSSSSISGISAQTKPSTSGSNVPKVVSLNSSASRKQVPHTASTTTSSTNSQPKTNVSTSPKKLNRTQPTIIKPEKQLFKDPIEDPLSLENINAVSDSESDEFALSDISADTFVSLSDVDEDERHIIELSNDSSYERGNLEKIRGSTPSPTVSDDFRSDKEDSPIKLSNQPVTIDSEKSDENQREISDPNTNVNKNKLNDSVDVVTLNVFADDSFIKAKDNLIKSADIASVQADNLLERIDSLLETTEIADPSSATKINDKNETDISLKSDVSEDKSTLPSSSSHATIKSNSTKDKINSNSTRNEPNSTVETVATSSTSKVINQSKSSNMDQNIKETKPQHERKCAQDAGDVDANKEKLKKNASVSKESQKKNEKSSRKETADIKDTKNLRVSEAKPIENKVGESGRIADTENRKETKNEGKISIDSEGRDQRRVEKHGTKLESNKKKYDEHKSIECVKSGNKKSNEKDDSRENVKKNYDQKSAERKDSDRKKMRDLERVEENSMKKRVDRNIENKKEGENKQIKEKDKEAEKRENAKKSHSDRKYEDVSKDIDKRKFRDKDLEKIEESFKKQHDRKASDIKKESPKKYVKEREERREDSAKRKTDDRKNAESKQEVGKKKISDKEGERTTSNTKKTSDDHKCFDNNKLLNKNSKEEGREKREQSTKKQNVEKKPPEKSKERDNRSFKDKDNDVEKCNEKEKKRNFDNVTAENVKSKITTNEKDFEKREENEKAKCDQQKVSGNTKNVEIKNLKAKEPEKRTEDEKKDAQFSKEKGMNDERKKEADKTKREEKTATEKKAEYENAVNKNNKNEENATENEPEKKTIESSNESKKTAAEEISESSKKNADNINEPEKKSTEKINESDKKAAEKINSTEEKAVKNQSEKIDQSEKKTLEEIKENEKKIEKETERVTEIEQQSGNLENVECVKKCNEIGVKKSTDTATISTKDEEEISDGNHNKNKLEENSDKEQNSENFRQTSSTSKDETNINVNKGRVELNAKISETEDIDSKDTSNAKVDHNDQRSIKQTTPNKDVNKKITVKIDKQCIVQVEYIPKPDEMVKNVNTVERNQKNTTDSKSCMSMPGEEDGITRRVLRKRGNDQSPNNNDQSKKPFKEPSNIFDGLNKKDQARSGTPIVRKRIRQNIVAPPEKEDKDSSPLNKKLKLDSLRKLTSSMHSDGKESEKHIDALSRITQLSKVRDEITKNHQKEKDTQAVTTTNKKHITIEIDEPPKKIGRADGKAVTFIQTDLDKSKLDISESKDQSLTPGKRYRRLKAIDEDRPISAIDKDKSGISDKSIIHNTENKQIISTRKSLRSKPTEEDQNEIVKPAENSKQNKPQQKQHSERSSDASKGGKIVSKDLGEKQTGKNNSNAKKDKPSPTKSPGNNVMTFTEWLQQKQGEHDDKCESLAQNEITDSPADLKKLPVTKNNTPTTTRKNELSHTNQKQANNVDNKKNQQKLSDKTDDTSQGIRIDVPRETRRRFAANIYVEDFKKPPTPQKLRSTPTRSACATPTPTSNEKTAHKPQYLTEKSSHILKNMTKFTQGGKVYKLRKLRIRINRSVVSSYFKNLKQPTEKKEVETDAKQPKTLKVTMPSNSVSDLGVSSSNQKTNRSRDKPPISISQKRVPIKTNATLPSLTVRPIMAESTNIETVPLDNRNSPPPTIATTLEDLESGAISSNACNATQGNKDDLSLLTPMKTASSGLQSTSSRIQQLQKQCASKEPVREKPTKQMQVQNDSSASTMRQESQLPFTPIEPKKEQEDEVQSAVLSTSSSVNSLASRTLAIAAATNSALNQLPSNDTNAFCGLTPTVLDANGTRLYSFLHPAKYNRNHGCVLLDYCCPNLDGPMPAIDPTRIHAQVQAPVRELPAYIVMTTKLITRADLEANKNVIPASIRQKVEKITADANAVNSSSHSNVPSTPTAATSSLTTSTNVAPTPLSTLQKNLPSTTTITPKLMPSGTASSGSLPPLTPFTALNNSQNIAQASISPALSEYQRSLLRSQVRQFDARLKKYYYRIAVLSFADRQRIIDGIVNSATMAPKEVEKAVRLLDEYIGQINVLPTPVSTSVATRQVITSDAPQKTITTNTATTNAQAHQLTSTTCTMNKSTMSTRSSALPASTNLKHSSLPNVALAKPSPNLKTPAQDSPRIFYTKAPLQTSTPIVPTSVSTAAANTPITLRSTPRMSRNVTIRQLTPSTTITTTKEISKRLPTLTRNPHLGTPTTGCDVQTANTVTTRSSVTVTTETKRLTRKTAAAAAQQVIIITQNDSRSTLDECILPDDHNKTEIKREKDDDDFISGS